MNRREREEHRKLASVLNTNRVPDINRMCKLTVIEGITSKAEAMDILTPASFTDKLLRQVSYISPWAWIVQLVTLAAGYYIMFGTLTEYVGMVLFTFMAPCLVLVLTIELVRSFGHNMWEMEAACRYNLSQIFAMRMCLVGGMDILVLLAVMIGFGTSGGRLLDFVLYVLLPFFVMASVCLWELVHLTRRCNSYVLLTSGIIGMMCLLPFIQKLYEWEAEGYGRMVTGLAGSATVIAAALFVWGGISLCSKAKKCGEERKNQWNLG